MRRVVVLGSCDLQPAWAPPGCDQYDKLVGQFLSEQGEDVESTGVSMSPGRYAKLQKQRFTGESFDYLAMEVTSSWLTVRTVGRRLARNAPKPIAKRAIAAGDRLTKWGGGGQKVWGGRSNSLKAKTVRGIRALVANFVRPRSLAAPEEFENFIKETLKICRKKRAGLVVLYAGVRSNNPKHAWAVRLVDQLEERLRKLQEKEGFAVVSMVPMLSTFPNPELMRDGLHPNAPGHQRFAAEIVGAINEMEKGNRSFWREVGPEALAVDPTEVWSRPKAEQVSASRELVTAG